MATQTQYAFFKSIYDEENLRYTQLEARAKFYLTVQTFYLGAIAFKFEDIRKFTDECSVPLLLFVVIGLLLVLGVLLTILAVRIRVYESPSNLQRIVESLSTRPPTDASFLDERLVDLAVATERNSAVNDKVANLLAATVWCLFCGIGLHFLTLLLAYIHKIQL